MTKESMALLFSGSIRFFSFRLPFNHLWKTPYLKPIRWPTQCLVTWASSTLNISLLLVKSCMASSNLPINFLSPWTIITRHIPYHVYGVVSLILNSIIRDRRHNQLGRLVTSRHALAIRKSVCGIMLWSRMRDIPHVRAFFIITTCKLLVLGCDDEGLAVLYMLDNSLGMLIIPTQLFTLCYFQKIDCHPAPTWRLL